MAYPDYTNNFDSKWKDSRSNPKYDVDDPTFCSPESVISGLVSGFCERQAVVNSSFVTGTTDSPVTSDWFAATSAGRDAIVDSCVQHVICHDLKPSEVGTESYKGPVDGSFHPVDRATVVDGGVTRTTTYMTHMDGLIDSLVQTGEYKTDSTGSTAYTTFEQLASSASAAAAGSGSACGLAVSGGTAYSSEFMPAFPKDWALERKWMMEQLRYTGGGVQQAMLNGIYVNCFSAIRWTISEYVSSERGDPWLPIDSLSMAYEYVVDSAPVVDGASFRSYDYTRFTFSAVWRDDYITGVHQIEALVPDYQQGVALAYGVSCSLMDRDWITHSGTSAYVNVYIAGVGDFDRPDITWDEQSAVRISGTSVYEIPYGSGWIPVVVLSGGTATISSGGTNLIGSVTVSSGGTLVIGQDVYIEYCNVMEGGKYVQEGAFVNGGAYADGAYTVYRDYRSCHGYFFYDPSSAVYVSGGVVSATNDNLNYFIDSGGSLVGSSRTATCCPNAYEVDIQDGGNLLFSSYKWKSGGAWNQYPAYLYNAAVHSGGSLTVSGFSRSLSYHDDIAGAEVFVTAGGKATLTCASVRLYLMPSGSVSLVNCAGTFYVHGGATLDLTDYVLSAGRLHPMCDKRENINASTIIMSTFAFGDSLVYGWNSYLVTGVTLGTEYYDMPTGMITGTTDPVSGASMLLSTFSPPDAETHIQDRLADLSLIGGTCSYYDIEDCTQISMGSYESEDSAWVKLDDDYMPNAGMKYYPNGGTAHYTSYASGTYFYGHDGYVYLLPETVSVMPTASALASHADVWVHWTDMRVVAVNGGTFTPAPCDDHYTEFRLRQNKT